MSEWPDLTLTGDMPIMVGDDIALRIRRGERVPVVRSVPHDMFDGRSEQQCNTNHGQTLAGVKGRGGLDPVEALSVLSSQQFITGMSEQAAHLVLYAMIVMFNRGQRVAEASTSKAPSQ